jgi:translocation and assembly module TamB
MRRGVKIGLWSVAGIVVTLLILVGGLLIYGNTDSGRSAIERLTSRLTGGTVKLLGLRGSFPSHLELDDLQLTDTRGVWLEAKRIRVDWSPLKYFSSGLSVDNLHVAELYMARLPQGAPNQPVRQTEVSIPRIDVANAVFDSAHLGAELAGMDATLKLQGSAHLHSLKDMQFDAEAQRIDGDGSYVAHLRFDPKRMDATLKLHEPASGPLENILKLPGLGALNLAGSFSGPRNNEALMLSLDAGELHAQAQGSLNLDDFSADLAIEAKSAALKPRADLHWSQAEVRGRWQGSLKTLNASGHVEARDLYLPGDVQLTRIDTEIAAEHGAVTLKGRVDGLVLPGSEPRLFADSPIDVEAGLRLDEAALPLTVNAAHRLLSVRGQATLAGEQTASAVVRIPDVGPFAQIAGQPLRGSASLNGQFKRVGGSGNFVIDAAFANLAGHQFWMGAVGDKPSLRLSASVSDAALRVDNLALAGRALSASGAGSLSMPARVLNVDWKINLSDLGAVSAALAGKLVADGSLQGPLTAFVAQARAQSSISVRGSPSGDVGATVKIANLPSAPAGTVSAQGNFDGSPLHVEVEMSQGGGQNVLHTVMRQAEWKSLHVDGDVLTAMKQGTSRGQVNLKIEHLEDLRHLLGVDIAGALSAGLKFNADQGDTKTAVTVDAPSFSYAGQVAEVHLSGEGFLDDFPFKVDVRVPQWRGASATLSTDGTLNLDESEVQLAHGQLQYRDQLIKLLTPSRFVFSQGLSVDIFKLGAQQAEFELQGRVSPEAALRISLRNVQPALVNAFFPDMLASGSIEAHAELHGDLRAPVGQVELTATNVRSADDAAVGLPAANLRVNADLKMSVAAIDAQLEAGSDSHLKANGDVPLTVDGSFDLKVSGKTSMRLLNPLLEAKGQHVDGDLDIDAAVNGTPADPQITGAAHLTSASWRDYVRGISLTGIGAELEGGQGAVTIKSMTATAAPGTLTATGSVGVLKPLIPVDIKITAQNAQPVASKLVTANFNAQLAVTGTARERLDIAGKVHLNRTLIGIPNGLPPNVAVLDVRRRGKTQHEVPAKPLVIGLDIAVEAPQQILVQGRGLDAEMNGDLHITGTTDDPVVAGQFDLARGSFSLASNRLNITSGRVSFDGYGLQKRIDPTLDFVAQTNARMPQGDANITLRISGLADSPHFDLSSDNNAAQDEILAALLFGASPQTLSGLQLAQIGAALASISGVGGDSNLNPLVKLQKSLGLDRLTIGSAATAPGSTENTGASIEAGRYISRRVYIEAKQSTTGTSQLQADVDLTKRLKLQTKLGNGTATVQGTTPDNDPGSSIGLSYQFEY